MPAAKLDCEAHVRSAKGAHESPDPGERVRHGGSGRRGDTEGDALRAELVRQPAHGDRREVERFIPADPLPARIGISLRASALQWIEDPVGTVDQLRRGATLCAQRLAGRVRRVWLQGDETVAFHDSDRAAMRPTQRAVALNPFGSRVAGDHHATPCRRHLL